LAERARLLELEHRLLVAIAALFDEWETRLEESEGFVGVAPVELDVREQLVCAGRISGVFGELERL
jgi:hypothetical protein